MLVDEKVAVVLKSWLVGIAITIVMLALAFTTPLTPILLLTIGLPYDAFSMMFDDIFYVFGIDRGSSIASYVLTGLAGIASSVFYGALVYFAPFVVDSLRRRKTFGAHN